MVAPNPHLAAQEPRGGLRALPPDVEHPPELERRSEALGPREAARRKHRWRRMVLASRQIPDHAKVVASAIVERLAADRPKPEWFGTVETLQHATGKPRRNVERSLKALRDAGFLPRWGGDRLADGRKRKRMDVPLYRVAFDALGVVITDDDRVTHTESHKGCATNGVPDAPRTAGMVRHEWRTDAASNPQKGIQESSAPENLPAEPNPRGRDASGGPEVLKVEEPPSGSDDAIRYTTTASTPPGVAAFDLATNLATRDRLQGIGLSRRDAALWIGAFSANPEGLESACRQVESKPNASNPPGLFVHIIKTEHPDEWDALQDRKAQLAQSARRRVDDELEREIRETERRFGVGSSPSEWHSGGRKSPSRGGGHPSSCTCEECFEARTAGWV